MSIDRCDICLLARLVRPDWTGWQRRSQHAGAADVLVWRHPDDWVRGCKLFVVCLLTDSLSVVRACAQQYGDSVRDDRRQLPAQPGGQSGSSARARANVTQHARDTPQCPPPPSKRDIVDERVRFEASVTYARESKSSSSSSSSSSGASSDSDSDSSERCGPTLSLTLDGETIFKSDELLFRKRGQSHRVSAARARAADAPASLALAPGVVSGAVELDLAPGLYTLAVSASAHHWLFCFAARRKRNTPPTHVPRAQRRRHAAHVDARRQRAHDDAARDRHARRARQLGARVKSAAESAYFANALLALLVQ